MNCVKKRSLTVKYIVFYCCFRKKNSGKDFSAKRRQRLPRIPKGSLEVGIKRIKAEAESREGVDSTKMDGYKVVYEDGYESWSPKEVFEKAYHESGSLSFSEALYALKRGAKIARAGWNGKGMFLTLQPGSEVDGSLMRNENAKNFYGDGKVRICPHIDMKAADGSYVVGWLASQTDMLACDWCIVE